MSGQSGERERVTTSGTIEFFPPADRRMKLRILAAICAAVACRAVLSAPHAFADDAAEAPATDHWVSAWATALQAIPQLANLPPLYRAPEVGGPHRAAADLSATGRQTDASASEQSSMARRRSSSNRCTSRGPSRGDSAATRPGT